MALVYTFVILCLIDAVLEIAANSMPEGSVYSIRVKMTATGEKEGDHTVVVTVGQNLNYVIS